MNQEVNQEQNQQPAKKQNPLISILDGSVLTRNYVVKQLPFLGFMVLLAFLYITNRNRAERVISDSNKLQKEIRDLRSESITIVSELMFISKQTEVRNMCKARGISLMEPSEPPIRIWIKP